MCCAISGARFVGAGAGGGAGGAGTAGVGGFPEGGGAAEPPPPPQPISASSTLAGKTLRDDARLMRGILQPPTPKAKCQCDAEHVQSDAVRPTIASH